MISSPQARQRIGSFAAPDAIQRTEGLPKTRSGKIMRRVLGKIAANENSDLGDTSTLADASVLAALIARRHIATPAGHQEDSMASTWKCFLGRSS